MLLHKGVLTEGLMTDFKQVQGTFWWHDARLYIQGTPGHVPTVNQAANILLGALKTITLHFFPQLFVQKYV